LENFSALRIPILQLVHLSILGPIRHLVCKTVEKPFSLSQMAHSQKLQSVLKSWNYCPTITNANCVQLLLYKNVMIQIKASKDCYQFVFTFTEAPIHMLLLT